MVIDWLEGKYEHFQQCIVIDDNKYMWADKIILVISFVIVNYHFELSYQLNLELMYSIF